MAIVCSSCDTEPPPTASTGARCSACGEPLIKIDTRGSLVGTTLDGRFEVLAPLGQGGMGVVYRGKQLSIGREVAIKVLDEKIERDVAAVKRFFREAKVASALAHPNTVPIVDFGQNSDGKLYLVMELVKGRTLHDEIVRVGALQVSRVCAIGIQLCDALEVAHGMAIVHRDLKLENVMLVDGHRDHVKILDFGLARTLTDPTTQMTATGLISGTPRYMPPEVAIDGAAPAPAQDMYSLGVILGELALGRALWAAPTLEALFLAKQHTDRSITDVPDGLREVVRSLLAEDPAARPNAVVTREMLRVIAAPPAPTERPIGSRLERARSPIALEPTASESSPVDPFANLSLVALDERDAPPKPAEPPVVKPEQFDAPVVRSTKLELDADYVAKKVLKTGTMADGRPPAVKRSKIWIVLALVAVVAVAGTAVVLYRYEKPVRAREIAGPGVTIEIKTPRPTRITVDGKPAGVTPVVLEVPEGTKPILIEGEGLRPLQVVPNRDQLIRLEPR